ncbi:MAG: T9SS type A sorting domain-containing protein, partial [Calditrichota bacterium]
MELIAFEAFIKGKDVVLQWQTGSEVENAFWYIDRKTLSREEYNQIEAGELELENSLRDYIRIATVEGQGSITTRTDYEFIDRNVLMSEVYAYRLADVSFNGEITFHTPVLVVPDAIPMDFALMQNYPNPFNPRTTIKYELPERSKVTLKIYNILGQEVVTLLDEEFEPGYYELSWDGRNNFEHQVASGVYIYRIVA